MLIASPQGLRRFHLSLVRYCCIHKGGGEGTSPKGPRQVGDT